MCHLHESLTLIALISSFCASSFAQSNTEPVVSNNAHETVSARTLTNVPRVVRVSTTFQPASGIPAAPLEGATLAIYKDEVGGTALWQETLNLSRDSEGRYTAILGSSSPDGLPIELFRNGEPRWLGIQFNRAGEVEQPRVRLASVPYALKAADAETLGGRPASAYQLAPTAESSATPDGTPTTSTKALKPTPKVTSGTAGFIAEFVNSTDLGNSTIYQSGGNIGIGTTSPVYALDILPVAAGAAAAVRIGNGSADHRLRIESTQPYALGMKAGFAGTYAWMGVTSAGHYQFSDQNGNALFMIQQNGNVGVGTTTPGYKLDLAGDLNFSGVVRYQGVQALNLANGNVAIGSSALGNNTTGRLNVAIGTSALLVNTSGSSNTAIGAGGSLDSNTTGSNNTAIGSGTLAANTSGNGNVAIGESALQTNSTGPSNTAIGAQALLTNSTGAYNTAIGQSAFWSNSTGSFNTAIGGFALAGVQNGGATVGSNDIGIGYQAGLNSANGSGNIEIGSVGSTSDSETIRIGGSAALGDSAVQTSFFAAGIRGVTTGQNNAIPVVIDSNGQLGTISSSARFKEDIHDMGLASANLMKLRPVTFRYKKAFDDGSKPIQYGLIAEEVEQVYPDLVARSANGQIETVKYQVLDSMLLNEVQRQERTIQEQTALIENQQRQIEMLKKRLAGFAALESRIAALESELLPNR